MSSQGQLDRITHTVTKTRYGSSPFSFEMFTEVTSSILLIMLTVHNATRNQLTPVNGQIGTEITGQPTGFAEEV